MESGFRDSFVWSTRTGRRPGNNGAWNRPEARVPMVKLKQPVQQLVYQGRDLKDCLLSVGWLAEDGILISTRPLYLATAGVSGWQPDMQATYQEHKRGTRPSLSTICVLWFLTREVQSDVLQGKGTTVWSMRKDRKTKRKSMNRPISQREWVRSFGREQCASFWQYPFISGEMRVEFVILSIGVLDELSFALDGSFFLSKPASQWLWFTSDWSSTQHRCPVMFTSTFSWHPSQNFPLYLCASGDLNSTVFHFSFHVTLFSPPPKVSVISMHLHWHQSRNVPIVVCSFGRRSLTAIHFLIASIALLAMIPVSQSGTRTLTNPVFVITKRKNPFCQNCQPSIVFKKRREEAPLRVHRLAIGWLKPKQVTDFAFCANW